MYITAKRVITQFESGRYDGHDRQRDFAHQSPDGRLVAHGLRVFGLSWNVRWESSTQDDDGSWTDWPTAPIWDKCEY